jgi:DNA-binding LacI/PurR family transcriptional regulator
VQERYAGFLEGLADEGLTADPAIVRHGLRSRVQAAKATAALIRQPVPPTAIFASNDLVTMGVIDGLQDAGCYGPAADGYGPAGRRRGAGVARVALVGFDEFALADKLTPPVTVVAQDPAAIGATAAQLLFARINGDTSPPRSLVLLTRLVPRGSGEIAPAVVG